MSVRISSTPRPSIPRLGKTIPPHTEIYELRERDEVALKMNIESTKCHVYKFMNTQHLSLGHGNPIPLGRGE